MSARPVATEAPRDRTRSSPDSVTLVRIYLALLFVVPSLWIVPGLGAAGRPAVVFGFGLLFLWILQQLLGTGMARRHIRQPVHWYVGAFVGAMALSYVAGSLRGLRPEEVSGADRTMLVLLSLSGVALFAADAVRERRQLDRMLMGLVYGAAFLALVGQLQFFTGFNLIEHLRPPFLTLNADLLQVGSRGHTDLARVHGTSGHFIEYGVVLSMVFPVALHYALHAIPGPQRQIRSIAAGIVALGIPLSISRSATLGLFVIFLALVLGWSWRARLNALVSAMVAAVLLRSAIPGLLGTIRGLFTNWGNDPSIDSREDAIATVLPMFYDRPLFGFGVGTFRPELYTLLDNQILGSLVSTGVVGTAALFGLWFGTISLGRRLVRRGADDEVRHLGHVLCASAAAAMVTSFTFDSLFFAQFGGVMFVTLGAAGALWRIDREGRSRTEAGGRPVRLLHPSLRADQGPLPVGIGRIWPRLRADRSTVASTE